MKTINWLKPTVMTFDTDTNTQIVACSIIYIYGDILVMPCDLSGNVFYSTPGTRSTSPPIGVQQA